MLRRLAVLSLAVALGGCSGDLKFEGRDSPPACATLAKRQGSCERDDGSVARVVDRGHAVRISQLRARVVGLTSSSTLRGPRGNLDAPPGRRFLVATLAVTNEQPGLTTRFATPKRQVFLYVDGREYPQLVAAARKFLTGSFAGVDSLPVGREVRGKVAFSVPSGAVGRLGAATARPEVGILNFSEAGAAQPHEWGYIRLAPG